MEKNVIFYDNDGTEHKLTKECFDKLTKANQKHYLGDIKWVLYQYICDLKADWTTIRCGNYAFEKINNLGIKQDNSSNRILNGEIFTPILIKTLDKKQIIISPRELPCIFTEEYDETIYDDDIILYFA